MFVADQRRIVPRTMILKENSSGLFNCKPHMKKWYFLHGRLPNNAYIENESTLVINRVSPKNQGFYDCHGAGKELAFVSQGFLYVQGTRIH